MRMYFVPVPHQLTLRRWIMKTVRIPLLEVKTDEDDQEKVRANVLMLPSLHPFRLISWSWLIAYRFLKRLVLVTLNPSLLISNMINSCGCQCGYPVEKFWCIEAADPVHFLFESFPNTEPYSKLSSPIPPMVNDFGIFVILKKPQPIQ